MIDQDLFNLVKEVTDSEFSVEIFYTVLEDIKKELAENACDDGSGDLNDNFKERIKTIINSAIDEWED